MDDREQIDYKHRCSKCGLPGYPSEFGRDSRGRLNTTCRECRNVMRRYLNQAAREGRILAPPDRRPWPKPNAKQLIEQRLCWQYMDEEISEDDWDELCDRIAGPIVMDSVSANRRTGT